MCTTHTNWHTQKFRAMGCQMTIWLEQADADLAATLLASAETQIHQIERSLTRFDETSELSQLNARSGQWLPVSGVLWEVTLLALQLAQATGGLFDPTVHNAIRAAGYTHSFDRIGDKPRANHAHNEKARNHPNLYGCWREIQVDIARQAIRLPLGIGIDFGGIGKGWTAQKIVAQLSEWGACLMDAGGDLTAGNGPQGWPGWPVGIARPSAIQQESSADDALARLWLCNNSLATSGIDYRQWQHNGHAMHHLIDPRSGYPANTDLLTVSVLARDAAVAEAWATAVLIAGQSVGYQLLQQWQIAAACIEDDGTGDLSLFLTPAMKSFVQFN